MQPVGLAAGLTTAVLMLGACASQPDGSGEPDPPRLTAPELTEAIENPDLFFLDVRSPAELEQYGTVEGYINIPLGELESRLNEIPRDKPILTA